MASVPARRAILPEPHPVRLPHALSVAWSSGVVLCQAAIWSIVVAALVVACACKGVNCFGDWSDE